MLFGVREICNVVFKAKANQKIGNKVFYKDEPVIYFDSLKTSSLEGAATTVYAQGGRGNSRLVAWEGERTLTFTMEDALISPIGFSILSGAGIVDATAGTPIHVHVTEQVVVKDGGVIEPKETPAADAKIYIMKLGVDGGVEGEPYIGAVAEGKIKVSSEEGYSATNAPAKDEVVLVDYYTKKTSKAQQIEIEAGKFAGNFYIEADTLFRTPQGVDMPAEFIIPNGKIQSNFTFTMAASGDPSTFTFTVDALPDYTKFDKTKKVMAAIQIVDSASSETEATRKATPDADGEVDKE